MTTTALPPELRAKLDDLIRKHKLEPAAEVIRPLARECIVLTRGSEAPDAPLGASRIGGLADVPAKFKWPREADRSPLCFIAQINLADLPRLTNHPLPTSGLLSLFVGTDEPAPEIAFAVRHLEGPLQRQAMPMDGEPNEHYQFLVPHLMKATVAISLPDCCSRECPDFSAFASAGVAEDRYYELRGEAADVGAPRIGRLLGWPVQITGDVRRDAHLTYTKRSKLRYLTHRTPEQVEADAQKHLAAGNTQAWEYVTETVLPLLREYKANEAAELAAEAEWTGLLSIHSDRKVDLLIWDAGFFTAVIREADLAAHNFDNVYCRVESS
jgi:uncharacterized protein YwqG